MLLLADGLHSLEKQKANNFKIKELIKERKKQQKFKTIAFMHKT